MRAVRGGSGISSKKCIDLSDCATGEICCGMPGRTAYCQPCPCSHKC